MIVVDRIEGDLAVLTIGDARVDVAVALLPAGAREGSVLGLMLMPGATDERLEAGEAQLARLRARNPNPPTEFDL
jgi:hypothetical protein